MNLLNAAQQAVVSSVMRDVFDTFARNNTITFYKEVANVIVADVNFNADFQGNSKNRNLKSTVSETFVARIWYLDRQEEEEFVAGDDSLVRFSNDLNRIRVQIPIAGLSYFEAAVRFNVNGSKWQKSSSVAQVGTLGNFEYCEAILQRVV